MSQYSSFNWPCFVLHFLQLIIFQLRIIATRREPPVVNLQKCLPISQFLKKLNNFKLQIYHILQLFILPKGCTLKILKEIGSWILVPDTE